MRNNFERAITQLSSSAKFAVGNDLVFVPSFQHSLTELFKKKVFTVNEQAYCDMFADSGSLLRYASTWAAKEAVYKAVKQLFDAPIAFNKIEIIRDKIGGKPHVALHRHKLHELDVSLTLSHDGDYAWAIAMIEIAAS
jgi:phosphopantetheine--protein transferase-like protein